MSYLYLSFGRKIAFVALFLLFATKGYSQSNEVVVIYDLDKHDFENPLPFDQYFKIKFKSTKVITALEVRYKVANANPTTDEFKKKYYFQKNIDGKDYQSSGVRDFSSQSFSIGNLGPLHASTPYTFEFIVYDKVNMSDASATELKIYIQKFMNELYVKPGVLPPAADIINKFNAMLTDATGSIYGKDYKPTTVNSIFDKELNSYKISLGDASTNIDDGVQNYTAESGRFKPVYFGSAFCNRVTALEAKILKNAYLLEEPVNLLIQGYGGIKLKDMVKFYTYDCNRGFTYLSAILDGKAKFNDKLELVPLDKGQEYQNAETLQLIKTSLILFNKLKKTNNESYFGTSIAADIDGRLQSMINDALKVAESRASLVTANANVPNILINKYTQSVIRTDYRAYTDVETSSTPYINLDLGLLYATELNDVFALQTANFHLVPVNRTAEFKDFKHWDNLWKRVCFQIGISQRLGPSDKSFHNFLLGDLGTPYMGIGVRLHRYIRFSGGVIVYQEDSNNPIVTDKITKGSLSFTLTINSGLSAALGFVGKVFDGVNK